MAAPSDRNTVDPNKADRNTADPNSDETQSSALSANRLLPSAEPNPAPVALDDSTIDVAAPFVGRWQTLVSTTNWEKGRIIAEWRSELESASAPVTQYSDDAWATLVGNVTSQHVGRLRRVHARFGEAYQQYDGLYWSHFQAAIDWQDAEMWLEGAVQNGWSISQMRAKRWETLGDAAVMPEADADSGEPGTPGWQEPSSAQGGTYSVPEKSNDAAPGERTTSETAEATALDADESERSLPEAADKPADPVRPFEDLAELPDDLADAFEQFKLAIVTHRLAGWAEASLDDVLASLDALKRLASAPVEKTDG